MASTPSAPADNLQSLPFKDLLSLRASLQAKQEQAAQERDAYTRELGIVQHQAKRREVSVLTLNQGDLPPDAELIRLQDRTKSIEAHIDAAKRREASLGELLDSTLREIRSRQLATDQAVRQRLFDQHKGKAASTRTACIQAICAAVEAQCWGVDTSDPVGDPITGFLTHPISGLGSELTPAFERSVAEKRAAARAAVVAGSDGRLG